MTERPLSRRSFLVGTGAAAALTLVGCSTATKRGAGPSASLTPTAAPSPFDCHVDPAAASGTPLWRRAWERGLVYGSSTATWQISDSQYAKLFAREAAILFTEDDLLWWRLRPSPTSGIDFRYGDRIVSFAQKHGMLVLGAHLVWDQGYGTGWKRSDFTSLSAKQARGLLFGTVRSTVRHFRGRIAAWITVNEAVGESGLRTDLPWYQTIGPSYVADAFHLVRSEDPKALLVLNDYGFETTDGYGSNPAAKRASMLKTLDRLLADKVPVDALGIQAHLDASFFPDQFDADAYRRFLSEVADRGLKILITELDVLDDTLPPAACPRDVGVANVYRTYLDVALDDPAIVSLTTFGLSDRYTWLQEDFKRQDGKRRRPLPFDQNMKPKAAFVALKEGLDRAAMRRPWRRPPRAA